MHPALISHFKVSHSLDYAEARAMKEWGITPSDWTTYSRADRAYMMAQSRIARLFELMMTYDVNEDSKRKAELERKKRGRNR